MKNLNIYYKSCVYIMKHCYKIYFHRMTLQAAEFSFSMCCKKN